MKECVAIRYAHHMTTAQPIRVNDTRELVAANLTAELRRQRYSDRQAATALGLTNVYVSRRTSGSVELSATDLVMFSDFLSIPITKLFEGTKKGPETNASGPVQLPDVDSNHEPAVTSLAAYRRGKAQIPATERGTIAPVTSIRANA